MSKTPKLRNRQVLVTTTPHQPLHPEFDEVLRLIDTARTRAVTAANTTLIGLYWSIGEHITNRIAADGWGKGTVEALAEYIQKRQLNGALFERTVLSPAKLSPVVTELHPGAGEVFKDTYLVEFLQLPPNHSEAELQQALVEKLKQFLIELGRDFCFIGTQYVVQVGGRDFAIDLLFFHRGLNCLSRRYPHPERMKRPRCFSRTSAWNTRYRAKSGQSLIINSLENTS